MKRSQFVPAVNHETMKFLSAMRYAGYRAVCIETGHRIVPYSLKFVFGTYGSVFGRPNGKTKYDACWPAIWKVVELGGFGGGCGNSHQKQLSANSTLEQGAYLFRRNKWFRLKDAKTIRSRA